MYIPPLSLFFPFFVSRLFPSYNQSHSKSFYQSQIDQPSQLPLGHIYEREDKKKHGRLQRKNQKTRLKPSNRAQIYNFFLSSVIVKSLFKQFQK